MKKSTKTKKILSLFIVSVSIAFFSYYFSQKLETVPQEVGFSKLFSDQSLVSFESPNLEINSNSTIDKEEETQGNKVDLEKSELNIQSASPSQIKEFDEPATGFSIQSEFAQDVEGVYFKYQKEDGSYSDLTQLPLSHEQFENDESKSDKYYSEFYWFESPCKQLEFYYKGDKNFSIDSYSDSQSIRLAKTSSVGTISGTGNGTSDADNFYTNQLFANMSMDIVTRKEWGANLLYERDDNHDGIPDYRSVWDAPYFNIYRIVVHHTAGPTGPDPASIIRGIHYYHAVTRDWTDIGYNYLIDTNGTIYEGRTGGNGVRGCHAVPNSGTIGISLLGNYQNEQPTQAALDSLARLIAVLSHLNNIDPYFDGTDNSTVVWHNLHDQLRNGGSSPTACAGTNLNNKIAQVTANAYNLAQNMDNLIVLKSEVNQIVQGNNYWHKDSEVRLILDLNNSSEQIQQRLRNPQRRVSSVFQYPQFIIYQQSEDLMFQTLMEIKLISSEIEITPNYIGFI